MQTILRFSDKDREAEFQGTNACGSMYFIHGVGMVCIQNAEDIDHGKGIDATEETSKGEREAEGTEV